jgi:hypothetical protein
MDIDIDIYIDLKIDLYICIYRELPGNFVKLGGSGGLLTLRFFYISIIVLKKNSKNPILCTVLCTCAIYTLEKKAKKTNVWNISKQNFINFSKT